MNWAQELVLKAASAALDEILKMSPTPTNATNAQNLYYEIMKYKVECRRNK